MGSIMAAKDFPPGSTREPILKPVPILQLRPTQMTVGMREVNARQKHWRDQGNAKKRRAFLEKHLIPVILGPGGEHYIVDHHHLALALHREGLKNLYVIVVANLSFLDTDTFWFVLDQRDWMHPFDTKGARKSPRAIPRNVERLKDDPYRSLAGELRRMGGYAKDTTPFSEFLWADFLRRRIKRKLVEKNFTRALEHGLKLAKEKDASYLPGWCGPVDL
jgi:hypothetical protein